MADAPLLEVEGLVAGYGAADVLRGIDLAVGAGEIVAVLGSNGAGKSTLNRTISGVIRARAGTIRFDGVGDRRRSPTAIVARGLVQVPEGRRIFPNLTVRENLDLGSYRRARARRACKSRAGVRDLPAAARALDQRAGTLSGGEQQMLAIGRGLMAEPRLIILDEPSLGLSPLLVEEMFALIARLRGDGLAVLLVEQNVVERLAISHRAYILEQGRFAIAGTAAEIAADPRLKRAYLGM